MRELLIGELNKLSHIIHKESLIAYVDFCIMHNEHKHIKGVTELHHILPKSKNLPYEKYKDLTIHAWNGTYLSYSNHYKAHELLAHAVHNKYILYAWHAMNTINNTNKQDVTSEVYKELRERHSSLMSNLAIARNKDVKFIQKRLEVMSTIQENGMTKFQQQAIKISKALKGKVFAYNMLTQEYIHVDKNVYDDAWFMVGRTAKYLTLYQYKDMYYRSLSAIEEKYNLDVAHQKTLSTSFKKSYKRVKIPIADIIANFNYCDSMISTNS